MGPKFSSEPTHQAGQSDLVDQQAGGTPGTVVVIEEPPDTDPTAFKSAQRKLFWNMTVVFWVVVVLNFLDKGNLAFASLQMTKQLGFSPDVYGLGAGLLFLGYAAFMVPANMLLPVFGGSRWLAVLCVAWGLVATASAAIHDKASFLALRFFLGVTEAGVVPAILFFLTRFYSQSRLTVPYTVVVLGQTAAQVVGAPLAAGILRLDGRAGLPWWRWLFILEGIPSVLVSLVVWRLPETLDEARYLTPEEKAAVRATLAAPEAAGGAPRGAAAASGEGPLAQARRDPRDHAAADAAVTANPNGPGGPLHATKMIQTGDGTGEAAAAAGAAPGRRCLDGAARSLSELLRVLRLPVVICGSAWSLLFGMSTQAFNYWTPLIVSSLVDQGLAGGGASVPPAPGSASAAAGKPSGGGGGGGSAGTKGLGHDTLTVLLTAVPFVAAALLQAAVGWHSQKTGERRAHTSGAFLLSAVAMLALPAPMMHGAPGAAFALLVLAAAVAFAGTGPNLSWKNAMLSPETRLTGMPVMIAVTSVGAFIGPFAVGSLRASSGNFYSSFWLLGSTLAAAAAMVQAFPSAWAAPGSEEWAKTAARRGVLAAERS